MNSAAAVVGGKDENEQAMSSQSVGITYLMRRSRHYFCLQDFFIVFCSRFFLSRKK